MPPNASKTVFVANIPYDVSEEQLANVFSEAGPVANVEIKFDANTGRSKGYAFVQFYDEATALSAVRNLQDAPVNGRNLRVELSTDEPGPRRRGPGPGAVGVGTAPGAGGPGVGGPSASLGGSRPMVPAPGPGGAPPFTSAGAGAPGYPPRAPFDPRYPQAHSQSHENTPPPTGVGVRRQGGDDIDLRMAPQGIDLPPGQKAVDTISKTLAGIAPGQMGDVMTSMKSLIQTNPDQARQLLSQQPQLAYALFQAMLLLNLVDPSVLSSIQPLAASASTSAAAPGGAAPVVPGPGVGGGGGPGPRAPSYPPYPPPVQTQGPPGGQQAFRPPPQALYGGAPPLPNQNQNQSQNQNPPYPSYPSGPGGMPGAGAGAGVPPPTSTPVPPTPHPPHAVPVGPPGGPAPPATGLASLPPAAQAALSTLPPDQQQMLLQVLQLSPAQIAALDPTQKASVMQLVSAPFPFSFVSFSFFLLSLLPLRLLASISRN
ncbi:cleavage stimulation factor subunit 2 [Cryptococcus neoformans C23]|nr:cleavage stimulation factor subunit 2 [Cryptococcus neoformans var. grubii C23]OXC82722.1 cleavage stimulation factor subunit 2 [Cryptococcus neoformans var. grubii AD1-7a]OXG28630.1 cleavage stimulation factor subunit 2 [Cryptococcus neoformans var. grubii Bt15]OXG36498.1 cleavage stimulation factor subunit 2 [Cryptococcus neoformans var. grubii Bt120]OXH27135.1 cleavage stimulation factor subunit 2 [Cryptococcus neoformans var. grubii]